MSNYPPGTWAGDPNAPWNAPEGMDTVEYIDNLDGQAFYESGNHDLYGTLDCLPRLVFKDPKHNRQWHELTAEEQALFERYADVVTGFAHLYEQGEAG